MATSKTLTPTNVTIQIPEFTDQPDQRVNSNCIDKEADAINALNGKIDNYVKSDTVTGTTGNYGTISSDKAISNRKIISARVSSPTTGIVAIPIQISTTWQFICMAVNNGAMIPYTNQSVEITYFYV